MLFLQTKNCSVFQTWSRHRGKCVLLALISFGRSKLCPYPFSTFGAPASFLFSDGPSKQATSFHESETFAGVDYIYSYTFFTLKTSYWREKVDEYCRNGKQPINGEENVLNSQLVYNFRVIEVEVTEIMIDT